MECPIPLQKELQKELNINVSEYAMFFSFYALPNIVLPLVAGILTDKFGRQYFFYTFRIKKFIDYL